MSGRRSSLGFTLIELLVVIAIIAILAAILFPVFAGARGRAKTTACMANLKQIGTAFKQYHSDWNGLYMPAAGYWPNYPNGTPGPFKSFVYLLSPYISELESFFCPMGAPRWNQNGGNWYTPGQDAGWEWEEWGVQPVVRSRSHYGHNIYIAGSEPAGGGWGFIPTEEIIPDPSRVIYISEANWVDIGPANEMNVRLYECTRRHRGMVNVVCCDSHAKLVHIKFLMMNPQPDDAPVYWKYNKTK